MQDDRFEKILRKVKLIVAAFGIVMAIAGFVLAEVLYPEEDLVFKIVAGVCGLSLGLLAMGYLLRFLMGRQK